MDIKKIKELEKTLEAKERMSGLRAAVERGAELAKRKPLSAKEMYRIEIIELLTVGEICRGAGAYRKATDAYLTAIRRTTAPGEPHVVLMPDERDLAMKRLERMVQDILSDKPRPTQEHKAVVYECARQAIDALKYYQLK